MARLGKSLALLLSNGDRSFGTAHKVRTGSGVHSGRGAPTNVPVMV